MTRNGFIGFLFLLFVFAVGCVPVRQFVRPPGVATRPTPLRADALQSTGGVS